MQGKKVEVDLLANKKPNILFVVFDQMRADALIGELADTVSLPNLNAFMADAVTFTNHVSVTSPCGPARASLLTGQYAMNHRSVRNGTPLPHDKPNLARCLRDGGIQPLLYGYTDTSPDPRQYPAGDPVLTSYEQVLPGFMEAQEMRFDSNRAWLSHLDQLGYDIAPGNSVFRPAGPNPDSPALYAAADSDTAFLTDRLLADLPSRDDGWCAHITFIRPHPPFVAPAPYNELLNKADMPAACMAADGEGHAFDSPARQFRAVRDMVVGFPDLEESVDTTAMMRAIYMGLVAELDHHFGRIVAWLKETGKYDDTIIIVTADHGEMLGDFGCWGKMHYYDAAYRVPLMIRLPSSLLQAQGMAMRGQRIDKPTESIDVTPTILDLMGLDIPDTMDGVSLATWLEGQHPQSWREFTMSELDFGDPVSATIWQQALGLSSQHCNLSIIRSEEASLVHFASDLPQILFDFTKDGENRNMAADAGSQTLRDHLCQSLLSHRMIHAEGRFARTMITGQGAVRGNL